MRGVRHAVLAVESGDASFSWVGAVGTADGTDSLMTPDTPYFVASITKLYIAAVVLRLVERDLVRLDDTLGTHLPHGVTDRLHVLEGADRTDEITVRHLLAHASGLPDYLEDKPRKGPRFIEQLLSEGDREVTLTEVTRIVRDGLSPHFPPGDLDSGSRVRVRYSDTNFRLLMGIIEAVLNCPWATAVRTELLEPIGLRHTWAPGSQPIDATVAPAALWAGDDLFEAPRLLESFGDLYSTLADQIAFLRALMNGSAFGDPATAGPMRAQWHAFGFDPTTPRLPGWPIAYGLGMMRFALPRWFTPFSPVPPVVGHTGSTGCWLFYCPELDLYTCGGVDQVTAGAVPFRTAPRVLMAVSKEMPS
jgi:CubicO group peptidase (beta-lactamase class C family)